MADYTTADLDTLNYGVAGGMGGPGVITKLVDVDLAELPAVLANGDTVDIMSVPAGTIVLGGCVEVVDPMTGTSLVDDALALELESAAGTDIVAAVTPTAAAGTKVAGTTPSGANAATNLQLAFALTSGTMSANGKVRVSVVMASL